MTQERLKKVREQITKLLKLADYNPNPHEAAAAAAKAQELMARYNLSRAEILTQDSTHDPLGAYIHDSIDLNNGKRGRMIKWKRHLINVIAKTNFCHIVIFKNTDRVSIVGEEHNIEFVTYLYEYLAYQLEVMGNLSWKDSQSGPLMIHTKKSTFLQSFFFGAINTIGTRLRQQRTEFTRADRNTMALVVQKDRESEAALASFFPHLRSGKGVNLKSQAGLIAGQQAGRDVNLNRPVNSGAKKSNHLLG
jgi:hypothetical protein